MKNIDIKKLNEWAKGKLLGCENNMVSDIKIDSRETSGASLFVCIVGEINDGHKFAEKAYERSCKAFLMSDKEEAERITKNHSDVSVILVADTIAAFEDMARAYLDRIRVRRVCVTGSVGKTTTKMLTKAVLSAKYNTICADKNLNTNLGVCLTSFAACEDTDFIVFETGMDARGQIKESVSVADPELAIITNVGISHMERLGSRDEIANAKLEVVSNFDENCTLVVNASSDYLDSEESIRERAENKSGFKIVSVGNDIRVENIKSLGEEGISFEISSDTEYAKVFLPLIGEHNAIDAALAMAAGSILGIPFAKACEKLSAVTGNERRFKLEKLDKITLIDDSYNASPDSMKAALSALHTLKGGRRIAVLADMFELGDAGEEGHLSVGRAVGENKVNILIAVGELAILYVQGLNGHGNTTAISVEDNESAMDILDQILCEGDIVLVKGSNGTKISEVAEYLRHPEKFSYEPDEIGNVDDEFDDEDEE